KIVQSTGGTLLFGIAITGMLLAIFLKNKKGQRNLKLAAILAVWFLASIYASLKGVRFTLLLGPAFAIAFGVGAGLITQKLSDFSEKSMGVNKKAGMIILIAAFGVIIATSGMTLDDHKMATHDVPIVNDAWFNTLKYIKDNSQTNAIINSWWDYGHHFKYFADRAVTFDGASQNSPMAHWIGKVLATKDEEEAVGILRMLDCGSNTAFEKINEKFKEPYKSVTLLYKIIKMNKTEAAKELERNNFSNAEEILKFTHCNPPEDFFITSGDMIGKAGVWAHFGLWDFRKADMWINMRGLDKDSFIKKVTQKYNISEDKAEDYYNELQSITNEEEANKWISPWPGYPAKWITCKEKNKEITCANVKIDVLKKEAIVQTQQGTGIAYSLIYMSKKGELKEKMSERSNMGLSVLLVPTKDRAFKATLLSPELSTSMFTRLYYLEGHGLRHFKKVFEDVELAQGPIYTWKIDWKGGEPNILEAIKPKTKVSAGDKVAIDYIGWLDNGTIFDSSIKDWRNKSITNESEFEDQETIPMIFTAGEGKLIPGFEEAIMGMKKGEEKVVAIPPEKAYGTNTSKHFLANKTLNFKIKVEEIV
ncbi:MAG TPA: hypothetical protein ENG02_00185, partial [Candidatus Woesearchaeota archaeon]|nr:hypothetical protein [Candidatus Woesearchaeota archaeon]